MPTNSHLHRARQFAKLMDNQFNLLGIRFGIESLLGFLPGVGDTLGFLFSLYLIWVGIQMQASTGQLIRMIFNLAFDWLIGLIPLVGDIGDIFFKANVKNLAILEELADGQVIEGEIVT